MSQYPYQPPDPYNPNIGYASPGAQRHSVRPSSVSGLAITAIVLGSIWLLMSLFGLASNAVMLQNGGRNPLAPSLPPMDPIIAKAGMVSSVVGLVLSIAMLAGSILA